MNKKSSNGSKAPVSSYEVDDIVLGKIRGYPPWPGRASLKSLISFISRVVDPNSTPAGVSKERPSNKKSAHYCVQFFPRGDFSWLPPKDISKLKPHEIESYITDPAKKSGELLQGYKIARDPTEWSEEQHALKEVEDDEAEGDEEDELVDESERPAASKKKKTAAKDSPSSAPSAPKKRKRDSEPGAKAKASGSTAPTKPKGPGRARKSKAAVESEDEDRVAAGGEPDKAVSPPVTKKAKLGPSATKDDAGDDDPEANKVREWRHRLQKIFLSSKVTAPKDDEMPDMDILFKHIETYDRMNIAYLQFSKIGKVMRHITALGDDRVPLDSLYRFRERARVLVDLWGKIINANRGDGKDESAGKNGGASGVRNNGASNMGGSESPNANNANENGIADAINSSVAGGAIDVNGHRNGHGQANGGEMKSFFGDAGYT
ncbi:hypothetical protein BDP27DRAFT_1542150 [Rhodocollybia butyracea]|uniref:PWWP domain-containing protein n=1 Tax=Rhodocollybia butyracea TaxID=206335 RepID=A0A9P5PJ59_9AGAR|nr:hypothetical protein BDP27DRAFT_1542150 [Rhodocollybia butyracea]